MLAAAFCFSRMWDRRNPGYLQLANASAASSPTVVFDCGAVPTLCQVEQVVLGLKNNRASGPDGITAEVLKSCRPAARLPTAAG